MTKPADAIKAVIDEALAPRLARHRAVLVRADDDPLPVARAELHYVWDDYGNQYLDFASAMNPVGHRQAMVSAMLADHQRYYHFTAPLGQHLARWPVQYASDLAEAFTARTGAENKVLFCEGEREAVTTAVILALHHTDRDRVAVLDTGRHDWWVPGERDLIIPLEPTSCLDPEVHGALLVATADVAARPMPVGPWIAAAQDRGIPVIVDESVTGFGRTGPMWGQDHTGHNADLTVLGGPVGGSLPLGAVVAPAHYFDTPEMCDVGSQAGHPLSCAAGSAVWTALSLGVLDHTAETAPVLDAVLDELVAQFPDQLFGHHGTGHLRGLRLRRPDPAFSRRARAAGLLVAPTGNANTVVIAPPLVASALELKRGVGMLADALMSWDDETPDPDRVDQVNSSRSVQN